MQASDHRPASLLPGGAVFPHGHLTGISGLQPHEITFLLDEAEQWIEANRSRAKPDKRLAGLTLINAFFENSTRTLLSFEIAGKRLGRNVEADIRCGADCRRRWQVGHGYPLAVHLVQKRDERKPKLG